MGTTELVQLINGGGYIATLAFLFYMVMRIEKALRRIHERIDHTVDQFVRKEECVRCSQRIDAIEEDYLSKMDLYREMGGWRAEIARLDNKLDQMMMEIAKR